jgi:hypothetical protein
MSQLSPSELRKYDWRAEVFIKKIKEKSPFEVSGNKTVTLAMPKNGEKILRSGSTVELGALRFKSTIGTEHKLSDFVKTTEFGGKGARSGVAKEDRALSMLNDQIEKAKVEVKSATVPITINRKTYKAFSAESTPGTPKSDFHLLDVEGNEIVWISHKDGRTERDFQQWGGMSERSEPDIYRHPEVQKFIKDLQKLYPNGLPNATTLARKIKDKKLQSMSVYGNQFGKSLGRQNVTVTIQGDIKLVKSGKSYKLEAVHVHVNGEEMTGGYTPVFMAIYKGDRSDFGVKGTRIVIAPMGSRKITGYI